MKYGYARVSTDDQDPALQLAALKKSGCRQTFTDHGLSGATTKRPALARCLKVLEHGDTLTVWKLDWLGRSVRDLLNILHDIQARGVRFQSITEAIDTEPCVLPVMTPSLSTRSSCHPTFEICYYCYNSD
jgi:DNA invertase Pin-like site-specific DNA recombinase